MLTEKQIAELNLKPEILEALREALKPMQVHDIYLKPKEGWDGDPMLHVYISWEGSKPPLGRIIALRTIREVLAGHDNDDSPTVTVMGADDYKRELGNKFYAVG